MIENKNSLNNAFSTIAYKNLSFADKVNLSRSKQQQRYNTIDYKPDTIVRQQQNVTIESYPSYVPSKNYVAKHQRKRPLTASREKSEKHINPSQPKHFKNVAKVGQFQCLPQDVIKKINKLPSHAISFYHPKNIKNLPQQVQQSKILVKSDSANQLTRLKSKSDLRSEQKNLPKVMDIHLGYKKTQETSQQHTLRNSNSQLLYQEPNPDLAQFMRQVPQVTVQKAKVARPKSACVKNRSSDQSHQKVVQNYYGQNQVTEKKLTRAQSNLDTRGFQSNYKLRSLLESKETIDLDRSNQVPKLVGQTFKSKYDKDALSQKSKKRKTQNINRKTKTLKSKQTVQLEQRDQVLKKDTAQSQLNEDIIQYVTLSGEQPTEIVSYVPTQIKITKQKKSRNTEQKVMQLSSLSSVNSVDYKASQKKQKRTLSPASTIQMTPARPDRFKSKPYQMQAKPNSLSVSQERKTSEPLTQGMSKSVNNDQNCPNSIDDIVNNVEQYFGVKDKIKVTVENKKQNKNKNTKTKKRVHVHKVHREYDHDETLTTTQEALDDLNVTTHLEKAGKSRTTENSPALTPDRNQYVRMWSGDPYGSQPANNKPLDLKVASLINRRHQSYVNLETVKVPIVERIKRQVPYYWQPAHSLQAKKPKSFDFDQIQRPLQESQNRAVKTVKKDKTKMYPVEQKPDCKIFQNSKMLRISSASFSQRPSQQRLYN